MRTRQTRAAIVAMLAMSLPGCVSVPTSPPTVSETRAAVCPRPLSRSELLRVADALEALPPGDDLDVIAHHLERLDDGARICSKGHGR